MVCADGPRSRECGRRLRVLPEFLHHAEVAFWCKPESRKKECSMRKRVLVGLLFAGPLLAVIASTNPASAWFYRGCGYGYAAPVYGYYAPRFYGAAFYRPRVWGWRGWGYRGWGYRGWGWRGGWGGRRWGGGWRRW